MEFGGRVMNIVSGNRTSDRAEWRFEAFKDGNLVYAQGGLNGNKGKDSLSPVNDNGSEMKSSAVRTVSSLRFVEPGSIASSSSENREQRCGLGF
jgi:hypothetical protein